MRCPRCQHDNPAGQNSVASAGGVSLSLARFVEHGSPPATHPTSRSIEPSLLLRADQVVE
jgi:hypothetical protein